MVYNPTTNKSTEVVFRKEIDFLNKGQWIDLLIMVRLLEIGAYSPTRHQNIKEKSLRYLDISGLSRTLS